MASSRKFGGRPKRKPKPGERVHLGFRVTPDLKRRVEALAKKSGRSISQEAELLIERSFVEEEALGGREMRELMHVMTANFAFICKREAAAAGHPDWTAKEYLADQECYRAAALHVCLMLFEGLPNRSHEEMEKTLLALMMRLGASLTRAGEIKWVFDEKEGPVGSGFIKPKDDRQSPGKRQLSRKHGN